MAYIFKHEKSPYWYLGWTNVAGADTRESSEILIGTKPAEMKQSRKDAEAEADRRERKAKAQREGREELDLQVGFTFDQLADKYTAEHASSLHAPGTVASRLKHLRRYFGPRLLTSILWGDVKAFLTQMLTKPAPALHKNKVGKVLSRSSVEHLRRLLRTMFNFAIGHRLMRTNPVSADLEVSTVKPEVRYLELDQVAQLLQHAEQEWRGFLAVALYCGLRKGEVIALRVKNVDMKLGIVTVMYSHHKSTKNGKTRLVPIPPELVPYLKVELGRVRSEYLFPNSKGQRMSRHFKTEVMIRQAAIRAGLVQGFDHLCRRKGCGHVERRADDAQFRCPKCSMRLWVRPICIDLKFKDTRSTFATHAYESTGDIRFVQMTLDHHALEVTDLYSAKRASHLTTQGAKISYGISPTSLPLAPDQLAAVASIHPIRSSSSGVGTVRDTGFEPVAFGSGDKSRVLPAVVLSVTDKQSRTLRSRLESLLATLNGTEQHLVSPTSLPLSLPIRLRALLERYPEAA